MPARNPLRRDASKAAERGRFFRRPKRGEWPCPDGPPPGRLVREHRGAAADGAGQAMSTDRPTPAASVHLLHVRYLGPCSSPWPPPFILAGRYHGRQGGSISIIHQLGRSAFSPVS